MDFNISHFLEKFKNIAPPDDFLKGIFVAAVKEETGIEIKKTDVKVEHKTIYVSASPAVKNELYIKKLALLERVRRVFEKGGASDIR